MYKYILLSLALLLAFHTKTNGQEIQNSNKWQHIIHLKNGSSIIGILVDYKKDIPAIIEVADGQRIDVPYESIENVEPITQRTAKSIIKKSKEKPYEFAEKGWHYGANLGIISRGEFSNSEGASISIDLNATHHFSRLLGIGISVGHEEYENQNYVPVQLVLTGYISPKNTTLFYSMGAGYGFAVSDQEDIDWATISNTGGLTLYPKVGIRLTGHNDTNAIIFSGIRIQKSSLETRWGEDREESILQNRTFKRLIIGIGIVF